MKKRYALVSALLWAAAILAAAVLNAPHFLSLILLPMLAPLSQLAIGPRSCGIRSELS